MFMCWGFAFTKNPPTTCFLPLSLSLSFHALTYFSHWEINNKVGRSQCKSNSCVHKSLFGSRVSHVSLDRLNIYFETGFKWGDRRLAEMKNCIISNRILPNRLKWYHEEPFRGRSFWRILEKACPISLENEEINIIRLHWHIHFSFRHFVDIGRWLVCGTCTFNMYRDWCFHRNNFAKLLI